MSKTVKMNKCKYIIKRGQREGKLCGNNTLNEYCKHHVPKRLEKVKNYNDEKNRVKREAKLIKKINNIKGSDVKELPRLETVKKIKKKLLKENRLLYRKYAGYLMFIGEEETALICKEKITGLKCICDKEKYYDSNGDKTIDPKCDFCHRTSVIIPYIKKKGDDKIEKIMDNTLKQQKKILEKWKTYHLIEQTIMENMKILCKPSIEN